MLTNAASSVAIVFDVLTGTLFVTIYPASLALKEKLNVTTPKEALDKPIYKTKVMATYELPHFTEEIDENAVKWTENNGRLFFRRFRQSYSFFRRST